MCFSFESIAVSEGWLIHKKRNQPDDGFKKNS
jgi:hypothetical protein